MNIRLANMRDLPNVLEIMHEVIPMMRAEGNLQWDDTYPSQSILELDIKEHNLFVAVEEGQVVGVVVINALFPPEYDHVIWSTSPNTYTFHRLMVHPAHRGKGIAETLFRYVEYRGQLMGLRSIRVDTNENNKAMLSLFDKYAYQFVGKVHFRDVASAFLCYEKTL